MNSNIYLLFAFIFVYFTQISESGVLYPTGLQILENKRLDIVCNYTDEGNNKILVDWKWSKDNIDYDQFSEEDKNRITRDPKDHSLSITKADKRDVGDWTCLHPQKHESGTIRVRAKPWLQMFEEFQKTNYKSANIIEGERFHLRCEVMDDYNRDAKVKWFRFDESQHSSQHSPLEWNKTLIPLEDNRPHITIEQLNDTLSTLTIDKVVPSDRQYYVCMSDNDVTQTVNNTILLRVKDKLGALWPFLGIVAEVVILCTIIFIYEKRRIKPDFDESDNDNNTEPKGTDDRSGKSQDVRQRK